MLSAIFSFQIFIHNHVGTSYIPWGIPFCSSLLTFWYLHFFSYLPVVSFDLPLLSVLLLIYTLIPPWSVSCFSCIFHTVLTKYVPKFFIHFFNSSIFFFTLLFANMFPWCSDNSSSILQYFLSCTDPLALKYLFSTALTLIWSEVGEEILCWKQGKILVTFVFTSPECKKFKNGSRYYEIFHKEK